jgi:7-cyano-7-deazaguanine synthase
MKSISSKALVLFSGGQDSAVCLLWALKNFDYVETVGFDYDQRHKVEMTTRQDFLKQLRSSFPNFSPKLGSDHVLDARVLTQLGETAMTHDMAIQMQENGLPNTFVPGRNLLFFTLSGSLAYRRGLRHIVGGMCETDYSGYPDCRDDTLKSQQVTLSLGLDQRIVIHTPLMWKTKAETFSMAHDLGGEALVEMIIQHTHTCYLGDRTKLHAWGYGCGECPACQLRAKGWSEYNDL